MTNNSTPFQPITSDLLAETYLDTSCVEDYSQAVNDLAQDIEGYIREANWFEKNQNDSPEFNKHDHRMSMFALRIWNATGRMAHVVCHSLL